MQGSDFQGVLVMVIACSDFQRALVMANEVQGSDFQRALVMANEVRVVISREPWPLQRSDFQGKIRAVISRNLLAKMVVIFRAVGMANTW